MFDLKKGFIQSLKNMTNEDCVKLVNAEMTERVNLIELLTVKHSRGKIIIKAYEVKNNDKYFVLVESGDKFYHTMMKIKNRICEVDFLQVEFSDQDLQDAYKHANERMCIAA